MPAPPEEAARTGAEQRFRAVLMTELAFIFGVLPLALSTGAGAGARQAVGVTVVGGMLAATVIGLSRPLLVFRSVPRTPLDRRTRPRLDRRQPSGPPAGQGRSR